MILGSISVGCGAAVSERRFTAVLPLGTAHMVPDKAVSALIEDADRLLKGEWEMLGVLQDRHGEPRLVP